jgi:thiol-disulfide isomerase/thioredoxin
MSASRVALLFVAILSLSAQTLSNRRAPSFSLPDSSLRQHDILDYRGSWLLLAFIHSDCPSCKQLSIKLDGVKKKYGVKVAVLSIVTPRENQTTVAKYLAETKSTNPIVFDSGQVAIAYFKATPQNPAYDNPHLFAISPAGLIVKDWGQGGLESPGFVGELDKVIAGPAAKK